MTCEVCGYEDDDVYNELTQCDGCHKELCEDCYTECDCCGDIYCEECLELHKNGEELPNPDRERCPDCKSKNLTLGKKASEKPYYADWYYCEDCGFHYRPR